MFNDITDNTSAKVQGKCLESAKEVASSYADRSRVGYWCFCDSGSGQTWKYNEPRPPAQFVNGEWGKLTSVMRRDFITSKHSAFKCSNMLQTRILTSKKVKPGKTEQNKPQNNLMFRDYGIGVQSILSVLRSEDLHSAQNARSASCHPQPFSSGKYQR